MDAKEQILNLLNSLSSKEQDEILEKLKALKQARIIEEHKDALMHTSHLDISTYTPERFGDSGFTAHQYVNVGVKVYHKLFQKIVYSDKEMTQAKNMGVCVKRLNDYILSLCPPFDLEKAIDGELILEVNNMQRCYLKRDMTDINNYYVFTTKGKILNPLGYHRNDLAKLFKMSV